MSLPLISVIVPVYKVENYLDRCVRSIISQHYRQLEIILVDDGSPDRCPAMCDAWAQKDSRITVIHKKNGGLSDARNAGMAAATGELMTFVDSDDYLSPDMYQVLYERMREDDSDIAACGVEMVWEDGTPSRKLTCDGKFLLDREEAMLAIIQETYLKQPVWYKLYRTSLIRDISFPVGKYHEDVFWSYQAVANARRVSIVDTPCYFYTQRSGSIMGADYSLKRLDALEAKVLRSSFVQAYYPKIILEEKANLLFSCVYHMQMSMKFLNEEALETVESRIQKVAEDLRPIRAFRAMTLKQRVWLYAAQLSLKTTCRLRNFLKIGL